jgi:hypothetical protein
MKESPGQHHSTCGAPEGIRTPNLLIRSSNATLRMPGNQGVVECHSHQTGHARQGCEQFVAKLVAKDHRASANTIMLVFLAR